MKKKKIDSREKILHETLDDVLNLVQDFVGREEVYKIFYFAFKELKKGYEKGYLFSILLISSKVKSSSG